MGKQPAVVFQRFKKGLTMKFDFCIGNPPYQEETAKKETKNGQKTSHSIFHYFQIAADNISSISSVLIYPAARWIHRSGKGMRDFGFSQKKWVIIILILNINIG